jgi:assimilatory nitrate reductase catalytic subunit
MAPRGAEAAGPGRTGPRRPDEVASTCCYCGVGCGVLIESDGRTVAGVRGDPAHPANHGQLCSKGLALAATAAPALLDARATVPLLRGARGEARSAVGWDAALEHAAARFAAIIAEHGRDAVAFYVSGQLLTEDYYVFNKLAKGLVGTNNIDTNSRLCMSSAVAGYKQSLGADAPPCAYEDIDHADLLLVAGANPAWAHPILYRRLERARAARSSSGRPPLRTIVIDPRRTETAREADLHLAILPGTDVALFNGMLHLLLWDDAIDRAYIDASTEGFEALKALVRDYPPASVAELCGIEQADLVTAARWFGESRSVLSLWCQGLNQSTSGSANSSALINLHLATAQIGRPGAGPFSLTGQPNAMGGREVGGLANLLSAHRDLSNPAHRAEVAAFWGVEDVPATPGLTAIELFDAVGSGRVKAVWIACTNPAQSLPDQPSVHAALERAEFIVLQEAYLATETAAYADLLLPASSWGEKEGTVTNSERRISRVRAAIPPPGEARADWVIARDFARLLEARLRPGRPTLFPWATAEAVWNEHRETTRGRDLDITGLSYARLESEGPQQWPMPDGASTGASRLYANGRFPTASGRARFIASAWRAPAEKLDARWPLRLNTGRLRDQWHAMSRSGTEARAFAHAPEPRLAMHPRDMARRAVATGDWVKVESKRGALHVQVAASEDQRSGQVFLPMHWGRRFLGGRDAFGVNTLTQPAFDPLSKQPELKAAAVRVTRAELPWRLLAFGFDGGRSAIATLDLLAPLLAECTAASATLIGSSPDGWLVRIAGSQPFDDGWLARFDAACGLDGATAIRYDDPRRHVGRRIDLVGERLRAVRLSGEAAALVPGDWLRDWLVRGEPVGTVRRLLTAPAARAPAGFSAPAAGAAMVCSCWQVDSAAIDRCLGGFSADGTGAFDAALSHLQESLRCGTNCGSCLPELRARIRARRTEAVPQGGAESTA